MNFIKLIYPISHKIYQIQINNNDFTIDRVFTKLFYSTYYFSSSIMKNYYEK